MLLDHLCIKDLIIAPRAPIIAGQTVILLKLQDNIDTALNTVRKKINKFSAGINKTSFELFTGGLVGSLPVAKTLKDFKDFEDKILFLSTKLKTTDSELARVEKTIRELGRTTSFTAQEVADGATVLAQAGFNSQQVTDSLQAVLDLARGSSIELGQAGAILANTLTVFNLEAGKASEVASQFTAAARLGTLDVLDLKESLKEVVGTLSVLNIDLPTSLALVTQLAQSSLKGTKAGTSLNTALLQLANKKDVLKSALGIDISDPSGNLRPISLILDELFVKLNKLGNVSRLAVIQRIFNIRGGRAVTGLLRDLENVRKLSTEIRNAGNEAREAAIKMDSGFGGAVRIATSAVQDLSLAIGKIVAGPLTQFLKIVPPLANALQQIIELSPGITLAIAALPVVLVAAGGAGLLLSFTLNKVGIALGAIGSLFGVVGGIINKAFTAQLITALTVQRKFVTSLKSIDKGLSATLLSPQKVGGRGRGANKIKPTSFVSRVGSTKLSGTGRFAANAIDIGQAYTRFGLDNFLNAGALRYFKKQKLDPLVRPLTTFMSKAVTRVAKNINAFGKRKALINPFQIQRAVSSPKGLTATAQRVASGVERLFGKLGNSATAPPFLATFEKIESSISKTFDKILNVIENKGTRITQKFLVFINQFGNAKKAPPFLRFFQSIPVAFAKLSNLKIKAPIRFLQSLLFGSVKVSTLGKIGSAVNSVGSALRLAANGGIRLFAKGLILLTKVDYVKAIYNTFRVVGGIARGFLLAANAVRRFVFSFSGFLTIVELLIIFGPKIDFIRKAFERLGRGISTAFSLVIGTFRDASKSFSLFGEGVSSLIRGEGAVGINQIVTAVKSFGDILRSNVVSAWQEIVIAMAPAYDFLKKMVLSTITLAKLLGGLVGFSFGAAFSGLDKSIGGDGGIIKSIVDAIDLEAVFKELVVWFAGIASVVNTTLQGMYNIIAQTMLALQEAIVAILDGLNERFGWNTSALADRLMGGAQLSMVNGEPKLLATGIVGLRLTLQETNAAFEKFPEEMAAQIATALASLTSIFKAPSPEAENLAKRQAGAIDKLEKVIKARVDLERAGLIKRTGRNPLTAVGGFLGGTVPGASDFKIPGFDKFVAFSKSVFSGLPKNILPNQKARLIAEKQQLMLDQRARRQALAANNRAAVQPFAVTAPADKFRPSNLGAIAANERAARERIAEINSKLNGKLSRSQREERREAINSIIVAQRDALQKARKDNFRNQSQFIPQAGNIKDVVAATVGSIQATRFNRLKVASEDPQQKQVDILENIQSQLGPSEKDSYLKQLVDKATPLLFAK